MIYFDFFQTSHNFGRFDTGLRFPFFQGIVQS